MSWVTNVSRCIAPILLQKYFRHHFLIIRKEKKNLLAGGMPETHKVCKQVVIEYLNVWFRLITPINQK